MTTQQQQITLQGDDWFRIEPNDRYNFVGDSERNPKGYTKAAIFVGVGTPINSGSITLVSETGCVEIFENIPSGTFIPCSCVRVNAAGTTVTNIKGVVQRAELEVK